MKIRLLKFVQALLNSYAILFFSQSSVLAALLLVVTFFNPAAGLAGLLCVCGSLLLVSLLGFERAHTQAGLYSFNSLLLGIGFGTFYHYNLAFWLWLAVACLLTVVVTVSLTAWLGKYNLPVLSLPFVLVFWLVLLAANGYINLGLLPKESYMLNELSSARQKVAAPILFAFADSWQLPFYIRLFFRSLSAIFFQDSVMAGLVISMGVFIHSRISFSLLIIGYATALGFNVLTGAYPDGLGHYHLGVNFMMISVAMGSFFLIPSKRSYLWAVLSVPLAFLLVGAFTKILLACSLPVLSLPFCMGTSFLLYFFMLRVDAGKLQLTPYQHYSPEVNLYQYLNSQDRLQDSRYIRLYPPFMGSWTVTQGYNGNITHKDGWAQALDFTVTDEDGKTYQHGGLQPEHYYSYGKPVLACADGVVEAIVSHVADNEIGQVNTIQNWGNSVVIKHATGLYSKVSHLKYNSVKVAVGDYVKQGYLLGLCGNSGRSPEPHLHFQLQATPYIGSQTIAYPFAYYTAIGPGKHYSLHSFQVPTQGTVVAPVVINTALKQAFNLQPGYIAGIVANNGETDIWEVHTDALNLTYLYSKSTGATAYFVNNGAVFYFTNFYGNQNSLLYYFYLAAYKVVFTSEPHMGATDVYPMQAMGYHAGLWLHDLLAPFYQFIKRNYQSSARQNAGEIIIEAMEHKQVFSKSMLVMKALIHVSGSSLAAFSIQLNGKIVDVKWQSENI